MAQYIKMKGTYDLLLRKHHTRVYMQCAHGIMFHHLHDLRGGYIPSQGSMSPDEFEDLIKWYGRNHNILRAEDFYNRAINNELSVNDVVITFDDGLRCQYDIASPVLKKLNLSAFYFIYTLPIFEDRYDQLEIFHHFRFYKFEDIDTFYDCFFEFINSIELESNIQGKLCECIERETWRGYKINSTFYTPNDRKYRYIRDFVLGSELYASIMYKMMDYYKYDYKAFSRILWMDIDRIRKLQASGNIVGLHTHSHPTTLADYSFDAQKKEWETSKNYLKEYMGDTMSVSYPCDSFNDDTTKILENMGVKIGFRAYPIPNTDVMFLPRVDSSIVYREMKSGNSGMGGV